LSFDRNSAQVHVPTLPVGVRIVEGSLAEHDARERSVRQEAAIEAAENAAKLLDAASASLEETRREALDSVAETAVQLALGVVQELLRVELTSGNYDIAAITRETLAATSNAPGLTEIHVNPHDANHLAKMSFRSGTTVESDPSVRRGDVHVKTDQGLLVREIDACVRTIRERILEEVE